ncbi:hypothetical protein [Streptomyces odontomachi]|uniref:hypothetical protein n=1 Tax=Streptomyces odontomachi TaxID=2944940 RepID=UPI00210CE3CC|nr:hypothetical protein [Streptomyces sp. ODS25]
MTDALTPACTICHRALWQDELAAYACRLCTERIDRDLRTLAGPEGLYARLSLVLAPGRGADGPAVSGSRTAPLPVRLEPLSLQARGGVVTVLQTWLIDFHERLAYRHPRWEGTLQGQLDQAVARLRVLLPWAAEQHEAVDEFAREVATLRRQCEGQLSGEPAPRRVPVQCGCGHVLRITLDTTGARCPGCETQYGHAELLELPLAERRAAA